MGLGTGSSSSLGIFRDRLPRERWVGWLLGFGSAGPCLRSQEGSGEGLLSRCARGGGVFAFNARSGTIPLPLGRFWGQAAPAR